MNVTALSQLDLSNQISVAVARKGLDVAQQQGDAIVQLLEDAADVASSSRGRGAISPRAATSEPGQRLDVTA